MSEVEHAKRQSKRSTAADSLLMAPAEGQPPRPDLKLKRIRALPIGGLDTASSRIRCYRFLENLPQDEFDVDLLSRVLAEGRVDFEVLYIQKAAHGHVLDLAREAIGMGIKVLYDIDEAFGLYKGMHEAELCQIATAVTVDTEARAALVRTLTTRPVHVVPDCLDYTTGELRRAPLREELRSVVTFGNIESLRATRPYLEQVPRHLRRAYVGRPAGQIPHCEYIEWRLNSFVFNLTRFDACVLVHDNDGAGNLKSNNRLLVAMSVGLPAIVSNTPAYAETVRAIGHPGLICDSPADVPGRFGYIEDVGLRLEIAEASVRYAWNHYSPVVVGEQFAQVLRSL